jgi:putative Ca2+/H+ antiporter (TMEM165/GDT1 family)
MTKTFLAIFLTVLVAEIGDKTQLATMLFASQTKGGRWIVFAAAALALTVSAAIAVLVGTQIARFVSERTLNVIAGAAFIVIGIWTIWSK